MKKFLILAALAVSTFTFAKELKPIFNDGPMPFCAPGDPYCCRKGTECTPVVPTTPVLVADGSDPMPLCQQKKCIPGKVRQTVADSKPVLR